MSQRPLFNIVAKPKSGGDSIQVGSVWPTHYPGTVNIKFGARNRDGSELSAVDALRLIASGNYWVNGYDTSKTNKRRESEDQAESPQMDLPF